MRVIAGEFRSRRLATLPGLSTRPTPDRLRETLFNVLAPRIAGAVFVDAYAGTGAVGIEALSRGAERVIFIERSRAAAEVIRRNLQSLGVESRAQLFTSKIAPVLERIDADVLFLDPPYEAAKEYATALELAGVPGRTKLAVAQHDTHMSLAEHYGVLARTRVLKQGSNTLSFYEPLAAVSLPDSK